MPPLNVVGMSAFAFMLPSIARGVVFPCFRSILDVRRAPDSNGEATRLSCRGVSMDGWAGLSCFRGLRVPGASSFRGTVVLGAEGVVLKETRFLSAL